ncbi:MAG TPA: hypothetical protein VJ692_16455 [Nitrospiraceae bacterium]|nr:hypothetical protein [Nitrospiraceae bacterium]
MKIISLLVGLWLIGTASPTFAQRAILPHGDPTVEGDSNEQTSNQRREEIRDQRLKQQGQGENYRIEGGPTKQEQGHSPGRENKQAETGLSIPGRQDTGLSDPTVNPGQAGKPTNR